LVDDTVVEVENMERHMEWAKPRQARFFWVGLAVLASAATIVAVFLPVAFMGGIPGQFFNRLGDGGCFYHILYPGGAYHDPMIGAYLLKPAQ